MSTSLDLKLKNSSNASINIFSAIGVCSGKATLLGDLVNSFGQVLHVLGRHTCHGNAAIFGQVNAKVLCQFFHLKKGCIEWC